MSKVYEFKITPMTELFYSEESLYGVYKFSSKDKIPYLDKIPFGDDAGIGTITGKMQRLTIGLNYECTAIESYNKKYNKWQYESIDIKADKPNTLEDKRTFLKCIITEKQTETILKEYPNAIEMILNNEDLDINKLKGIGEKTLATIKEKVIENYILSDVIIMLKPYGISNNMIKKIFENEKNAILLKQKLKNNPYILTEIKGLGFKKVDSVAIKLNPQMRNSEQRMKAFIGYYLTEIGNKDGHSRIGITELIQAVKENVYECFQLFNNFLEKECNIQTMIHISNDEVGLLKYYNREKEILERLNELDNANSFEKLKENIILNSFDAFKRERSYDLVDEQKEIVYALNENNVVLLTGKAGAGKSSAIDVVLKAFKNRTISLTALSAKAVRRIVETTGVEDAKTIHRLLGFEGKNFKHNENEPLNADIFIVDEASMINSSLFLSLLRAIPTGSKLLIVFDDGQLPPIGVGNIATDLLNSKFKHIALNKVFRQAMDSGILSDANSIRDGINPINSPTSSMVRGVLKDMYYIFESDKEEIFNKAINYFMRSIQTLSLDDVVICVPRKENCTNSALTFNNRIQDLLLGNEKMKIQKGDKVFKLGTKLIQKTNNYERGVVNGEIGFLIKIVGDMFHVEFDNEKVIEYNVKEMDELELAYALTTHSMQGSQCNTVIIPLDMNSYTLLSRELIYTAITRASKRCLVISQPKSFNMGIKVKASKRNTWLQNLLEN